MSAMLRQRGVLASRLYDTDPGDWRTRAACVGHDPELWFPLGGFPARPDDAIAAQISLAVAICRECPVIADCAAFAARSGETHGIWGGQTAAERRRSYLTESNQISETLRRCQRCRVEFSSVRARYCSQQCKDAAARAMRSTTRPDHTEHVDTVDRLAASGATDTQIAAVVGLRRDQVQHLRRRQGIPAGNRAPERTST